MIDDDLAFPSGLPCLPKISLVKQCALLCEQCIAHLETPGLLSEDETVHDLRVATKRLRAAWHLVKAADRDFAKRRRTALREISAALAGQRDLHVLLGLASELASGSDNPDAFAYLINALSKNPDEAAIETPSAEDLRKAWAAELTAWRALEDQFDDPDYRRKIFRVALRKSERRTQRATRAALADPKADAELWHDWRKAVKRLRYQREFIAASQGRQLGIRDGRINRLGSRLGERNDLANLIAAVERLSDLSQQQHGKIRKAIAQRERSILSSARRLGRLAFLR